MSNINPSKEHLDHCSATYWYPRFAHCTIRSCLVPLTDDFLNYLESDGLILPLDDNGNPEPFYQQSGSDPLETDDDSGSLDQDDQDPTHDDEEPEYPSFPELQQALRKAIDELGGSVFPKLNWSSPKDASWIALDGTLRCRTPNEVFLLLKSSDFIMHDLNHAYDQIGSSMVGNRPENCVLFLRKWCDLIPSMEFRCFVKDRKIFGISQRDVMNYYPFLRTSDERIVPLIMSFFDQHIRDTFPEANYVMDVYVNKARDKVHLLDFNPFSLTTDSLLFEWPQILDGPVLETPHFLVIEGQDEVQGAHQPAYSINRLPKEVIDLSNGASIEEFATRFQETLRMMDSENN